MTFDSHLTSPCSVGDRLTSPYLHILLDDIISTAHDVVNAYGNVKLADGMIAVDSWRDSLNCASSRFKNIDDDGFERAPVLSAEF